MLSTASGRDKVSAIRTIAALGVAVLFAAAGAGCRADPSTARGTAERFLDAHYVEIDLPTALPYTSGLARQKVEHEIELVKGYLALERLQLENRLHLDLAIDPALQEARLPPLLLQTLVENAVKHGIARRLEGGTVRISATPLAPDRWQLQVENPVGELPDSHEGHGIGLRNARERLRAAFGELAKLDLTVASTARATAELPL